MHHKTILFLLLMLTSTATFSQKKDDSCNSGKAFLGINYSLLTSGKAKLLGFNNSYGDYVTKVIKNTAADKGGLQIFDYIYGMDDFRVGKDKNLGDVFQNYKPGDKAVIHFYRKGRALSTEVVFGDKSDVYKQSKPEVFFGVSENNGYDEYSKGVKINVIENSTAAEMGLKNGDLIMSVNTYPMITWSDLSTAIEAMSPGEKIRVTYERDGQTMRGELPIKSLGETKDYAKAKQKKKEKPFLGINYDDLSLQKAGKLGFDNPYGTYITKVYSNTAAERAGLLVFDYLYGIDNYTLGKEQSLGVIMKKYNPGDKAVLHILRDGGKIDLEVVFGTKSDKKEKVTDKCEIAFFGIVQIKNTRNGVAVEIIPNSTAEAMGMNKGDIILSINNQKTYDWTDIRTAIYHLKVGDEITVEFNRVGRNIIKTLPVKSYCETKKVKSHGAAESFGKEVEAWAQTAPGILEEGDPVDINNVNLMISEITSAEASLVKYDPSTSDLQVDFLSISPHPASGKFLLEFNLSGAGNLSVRLHNSSGREIYSYEMNDFTGAFSDTVNISQNGTGNYYIEIKHGNMHLSKKITLAAM